MKIEVEYGHQEEEQAKPKLPVFIKKFFKSAFILLVLAITAGLGYTFYIDAHNKVTVNDAPTVDPAKQYHTIVAPTPDPNSAVGVSVQLITSPIARGAVATESIKTYPGATCSIKVMYNNVASTEVGLENKVADSFGIASWDWTIGQSVPEGSWPTNVTCSHHSKSGVVQSFILVTPN